VQSNNNITKHQDYYISRFLTAAMNYDEAGFEKIFGHCLLQFPLTEFYRQIIYPLLVRIGMMWSSNDIPPANEHYISNLIRQKIFTAIDGLPLAVNTRRKWLCFLPENEFHEIGLLFASYIIRSKGDHVIYLGSNLPVNTLGAVANDVKATHVLTFMVSNNSDENYETYINTLSEVLRHQKLFIAANEKLSVMLRNKPGIQLLNSIEKLEQELI